MIRISSRLRIPPLGRKCSCLPTTPGSKKFSSAYHPWVGKVLLCLQLLSRKGSLLPTTPGSKKFILCQQPLGRKSLSYANNLGIEKVVLCLPPWIEKSSPLSTTQGSKKFSSAYHPPIESFALKIKKRYGLARQQITGKL